MLAAFSNCARYVLHIVFTLPHELSALVLQKSGCSMICFTANQRATILELLAIQAPGADIGSSRTRIPGDRT